VLHTLDIVTAYGRPMRLLFVPVGTAGPNPLRHPLNHPNPTVEIFDRSNGFDGEHGHFTGAYYHPDDLLDRAPGAGLAPRFGTAAWDIDGDAMDLVAAWLRTVADRLPLIPGNAATAR